MPTNRLTSPHIAKICNSCDLTVHSSVLTVEGLYTYTNSTTITVHFDILPIPYCNLQVHEITPAIYSVFQLYSLVYQLNMFGLTSCRIVSVQKCTSIEQRSYHIVNNKYVSRCIYIALLLKPGTVHFIILILRFTILLAGSSLHFDTDGVLTTLLKLNSVRHCKLTQQTLTWPTHKDCLYATNDQQYRHNAVFSVVCWIVSLTS